MSSLYCPFILYLPAASGICDKDRIFCLCLCTVESLSVTKAAGMSSSMLQENEKASERRERTQHAQWQPKHIFVKKLN